MEQPRATPQERLAALLLRTRLVAGEDDLLLIALPREEAGEVAAALAWTEGGARSLTVDRWEASLVVAERDWRPIASRFPVAREEGPYRLITFDIVLPFDVVGFLAAVTARLAAEGLSVYALSAFSRDHILVRRDDAAAAVAALEALIAGHR